MVELLLVMVGLVALKALAGFHFPWEKCECCGKDWRTHHLNETGFYKDDDLVAALDPLAASDNLDPTWCPTCHEMWEECKCCGVCGEMCSKALGVTDVCPWGDE